MFIKCLFTQECNHHLLPNMHSPPPARHLLSLLLLSFSHLSLILQYINSKYLHCYMVKLRREVGIPQLYVEKNSVVWIRHPALEWPRDPLRRWQTATNPICTFHKDCNSNQSSLKFSFSFSWTYPSILSAFPVGVFSACNLNMQMWMYEWLIKLMHLNSGSYATSMQISDDCSFA